MSKKYLSESETLMIVFSALTAWIFIMGIGIIIEFPSSWDFANLTVTQFFIAWVPPLALMYPLLIYFDRYVMRMVYKE